MLLMLYLHHTTYIDLCAGPPTAWEQRVNVITMGDANSFVRSAKKFAQDN